MHRSITIVGLIVAFIGTLTSAFNIQLPYTPEEIEKALTVLVTLIGLAVAWYGRWRKGDVSFFGKRFTPTQPPM
jgi:hypothetical protein